MTVASTLALLSLLFPPVSIVSSATVALVTLRLGGKEGLLVLAGGSLVAAVLSMLLSIGYQFALVYGLVLWTPIWLIAIILREGKDLVIAVEIAVLLGIAGFAPPFGETWACAGEHAKNAPQATLRIISFIVGFSTLVPSFNSRFPSRDVSSAPAQSKVSNGIDGLRET